MNDLPQDCIAKILSLTTPRDVCRSSAVSRIFSFAADSDDVWNQFFPSDLPASFEAPADLPTRKRLFFSLVHNPLLLHDAQLSFSLERKSGKKCYMMGARALDIVWGNDQRYWHWISLPNTRSLSSLTSLEQTLASYTLVLSMPHDLHQMVLVTLTGSQKWLSCSWFGGLKSLEISTFPFSLMTPSTPLSLSLSGIILLMVEASFVLPGTDITDDVQPSMVSLMQNPGNEEEGQCAELRRDGWYEVELGQFFKRRGDMGQIQMGLMEIKRRFEKKTLFFMESRLGLLFPNYNILHQFAVFS